MRKTYGKPHIYIESFQLNAAIAASCSSEGKVPLGFAAEQCMETVTGAGFFADRSTCHTDIDDVNPDGICYHSMTDTNSVYLQS